MRDSTSDARTNHSAPAGFRTLLAVDDEPGVLFAVREALRGAPYRVVSTTDANHALQILAADPSIDLLILDLFMPSMHGAVLLQECRRLRHGMGAVLMTGLASQQELRKWRARGEFTIAKPWREGELAAAVAKAVERGHR
jgi:DNA-binding NtrC family response regulator